MKHSLEISLTGSKNKYVSRELRRSPGTVRRNLARGRAIEGSAAARCEQAVPWHRSGREGPSRWQPEGPAAERSRKRPRIPPAPAELQLRPWLGRMEGGRELTCGLQDRQGFPPEKC